MCGRRSARASTSTLFIWRRREVYKSMHAKNRGVLSAQRPAASQIRTEARRRHGRSLAPAGQVAKWAFR
eukprot:scaffold265480_cov13-Tisochrysis_lutea.AAC.1